MKPRVRAVSALTGLTGLLATLLVAGAPGVAQAAQSGPCALTGDQVGPVDEQVYLRPEGEVTGVVLYVDFSDVPARGAPDIRPTTEGVRDRLLTLTDGGIALELTPVRKWFRMPQPSSAYEYDMDDEESDPDAYLKDVLRVSDAEVDFSQFDIIYWQSAPGADALSTSLATAETSESIVVDGKEVGPYVSIGSTVDDPADQYMEHETLHLYGLPDLYAFEGDEDRFVGGFDVMGFTVQQFELLAWNRWKLGTVADDRIVCLPLTGERQLTLEPLTSDGTGPIAFVVPLSAHRRLVGEYRTREGLDAEACRTGLLLYTLDDRVEALQGPVRVIDSRPASEPPCANELDDAPFDLERPSYDDAAGVEVTVLAMDAGGLRVQVAGVAPAPGLALSPSTVSAGEAVTARWTGEPGQVVEVLSRTQPATEFSRITTITLDANGRATTTHRPQRNTRLTGRTEGATARGPEPLISVRSVASINVRSQAGTQAVTGRVYPARPNRIVSLYRNGRLVAQGRCDQTGVYTITTRAPGGAADLQVRTGSDTYNTGSSSRILRVSA